MDGTFVPTTTGHLPIDFRQQIKYNCINRQINKNPSPYGEGPVQAAERVGILSTAYKIPQGSASVLTAVLNKSGDRTVKVQEFCD
jgi:hypothetical protein